jgi:hypothetical protein
MHLTPSAPPSLCHVKVQPPCFDAQVPAATSLPSPIVPSSNTYAHPAKQSLDATAEGGTSNALFIPPPCDGAADTVDTKLELSSAVNPDPQKDVLDLNCVAVPELDGTDASVAKGPRDSTFIGPSFCWTRVGALSSGCCPTLQVNTGDGMEHAM